MGKSAPLSKLEIDNWRAKGLDPKSLGEALHMKRVSLGVNLKDAADQLKVHTGTIRNWENGRFDPNAIRLINWLFGDFDVPAVGVWKARAQSAEAVVKDLRSVLKNYDQVRSSKVMYP